MKNGHDKNGFLPLNDTVPGQRSEAASQPKSKKYLRAPAILLSTLAVWFLCLLTRSPYLHTRGSYVKAALEETVSTLGYGHQDLDRNAICPQTSAIAPEKNSAFLAKLEALFNTEDFKLNAYESLGGAVRIPTIAYDDLAPPGEDERWEVFGDLHKYLKGRFPLLHENLKQTHVNHYGLVYSWEGRDDTLKPILLTAHQDVVPVESSTWDEWEHAPFSGDYDGEYIWGRGSCDDKPGLIGSLAAVEELLRVGFQPTRPIVLAYGIDEERGGISGATAIRDYLLTTYGEDAFSILIDEGGGYHITDDVIMSSPGIAEKGKFDVRFEISAPGGHSSVPPAHTSIGMLAAVIKQLEDSPHTPHLKRSGIYHSLLQCQAVHDPGLPWLLRQLILRSRTSDRALATLEDELARTSRRFGALAGTTQAADVIRGGVKVNALPEHAEVIVNHRIDIYSSVGALKRRIEDVVRPVVERFGLDLDAFGETVESEEGRESAGLLKISDAFGTALEPAPITPTGRGGPFQLLSGTIIGVLGSSGREGYDKKVFIAPGMSTGNTDTKHYWKLTKHIFRYGHRNAGDSYNGAHTVNEALRAEGFIENIRFFTWVILNADESPLLE
ncbi:carboxypeptidase S [Trametes meyenii]|nr:carboxypeptidase S [Trametes meyenii]